VLGVILTPITLDNGLHVKMYVYPEAYLLLPLLEVE